MIQKSALKSLLAEFFVAHKKEGMFHASRKILGFNKAVLLSLTNKIWSSISGLITIFFITTYFSASLQGFYYVFNSLLIFTTLLDIGFGIVLVQFVSHEFAHLTYSNNEIIGDKIAESRLASLVRISIRWYLFVAFIFFLTIGIGGYWFLNSTPSDIKFGMPWMTLVTVVSLSIIISPFKYLLEGSNKISELQKILLIATIGGSIATWLSIKFFLGLYTPAITSFITFSFTTILIFNKIKPFLKLLKKNEINDKDIWKNEFWKQQWKIGLSWLCGFLMFQAFTPLSFKLLNPIEAGKVGATMQLYNLINMIGLTWINVVGPQMGILGAKKDFLALKKLIKITFLRSIAASLFTFCFIMLLWIILKDYHIKQIDRFTNINTAILILFCGVTIQASNILTSSIRFQKREPFLLIAFISSLVMIICVIYTVKLLGSIGFGISFFFVINLILTPSVFFIYKKQIKSLTLNANY